MSKIGQNPITIPSAVTVDIQHTAITVKGPKGELAYELPHFLKSEITEGILTITRKNDTKKQKSFHGLFRTLVQNAVTGVETVWSKRLEIVGTGYNGKMQGQGLVLKLGYSHPVVITPIDGVTLALEGNNIIIVSGIDRQLVGQVAQRIKSNKKPDAYKGKGIRYEGEHIKLKPGKKAKTA